MAASSLYLTKYDVFLSFRGPDTRQTFISHLHSALIREGVVAFIDDEFDRGDEIESTILKAIQDSYVSVVVFSKNYASSPWCLDELAKIMECMKTQKQKVLPVFYHVDPEDVANQTGSYLDAFVEYEKRFDKNINKVQKWRNCLMEATYLGGWDANNFRSEAKLVDQIVEDILKKLKHLWSDDFDGLVDIKPRVEQIESLLDLEKEKAVRTIGLWGMGGIGKTTLARVVFNKISSKFEGSCFLANVKEESTKQGLDQLRQELLVKILNEGRGRPFFHMMNQLRRKRVVIVLDDVNDYAQLEALAGKQCWFGEGSRIIVTSRDKHVFQDKVDMIYEVQPLIYFEALRLFSLFAFKKDHPEEDYKDLSHRAVVYVKGNPLALRVLGLFLYSRSKQEWEGALKKLARIPNMQIQKVLKISYDGLDAHDQDIFLNVACFFKGEPISQVIKILDASGFFTLIGLRELADKSLITMENSKVHVHDLLQEMGREIVRQESIKEPGKRSKLWDPEDIYHVLTKNTGTDAVEGMFFDKSRIDNELQLAPTAFLKMTRLKMLKFYNYSCRHDAKFESLRAFYETQYPEGLKYLFNELNFPEGLKSSSSDVHFPQGLDFLPNQLRYFHWDFYPLKSLPSNFHPEHLVELDLSGSHIERLWNGVQNLPSLKVINLRHCKNLIEMPDFSRAPKLENSIFEGCTSLTKVSPSVRWLINLVELNLEDCIKITNIPSTTSLQSLKTLNLSGCSSLNRFPEVPANIENLNLEGTTIAEIPTSIGFLSRIEELDLSGCTELQYLPDAICKLQSLHSLAVTGLISDVSSNIGQLTLLRHLSLRGNYFSALPESIKQLLLLEDLDVSHCKNLQSLPELPLCLKWLNAYGCDSLEKVSSSRIALVEDWEKSEIYKEEFFFINCLKLDQNSLHNIKIHAQGRILLLASAALEQNQILDKCYEETEHSEKPLFDMSAESSFFFPGKEIPEWISDQTSGSSITIELPPNWFNKNLLGFALCVVLADDKDNNECPIVDCLRISCEFEFKSNCDESTDCGAGYTYFPSTSITLESEHVLMWYDFLIYGTVKYNGDKHFSRDCYNEACFEFYSKSGGISPGYVIKECGVRLLYNNGDECSQDPMQHSSNVAVINQDKGSNLKRSCDQCYEDREIEPESKRLRLI